MGFSWQLIPIVDVRRHEPTTYSNKQITSTSGQYKDAAL
jgi:hypothetical protein